LVSESLPRHTAFLRARFRARAAVGQAGGHRHALAFYVRLLIVALSSAPSFRPSPRRDAYDRAPAT